VIFITQLDNATRATLSQPSAANENRARKKTCPKQRSRNRSGKWRIIRIAGWSARPAHSNRKAKRAAGFGKSAGLMRNLNRKTTVFC